MAFVPIAEGLSPTAAGGEGIHFWFTGLSGYPDDAAETALADFLDHGDCLFVSSQEYLYNFGSKPTAFMQNYLGVDSAADDVAAITIHIAGRSPTWHPAQAARSQSPAWSMLT